MPTTEALSARCKNFINGEWVSAASSEAFDNRSPADGDDLIGEIPRSNASDVEAAVSAARDAFPRWRLVPAPKRAEVLYKAAELLAQDSKPYPGWTD